MINADDISVLGTSPMDLTDKNLLAYCDNNPIVRADDDGEFWGRLALAVGNGRVTTKPERHYDKNTGSALGYWYYHDGLRSGGHIFYVT